MEKTQINGKIYTIRSPNTDKYYIGSTTQKYLSERMAQHRCHKNTKAREIINLGGAYIELLENYKCNTKDELYKREGELQRIYKNDIINKQISKRSKEEYEEDNKQKQNKKIVCICGSEIRKGEISRHKKTKKHLDFIV